MQLHSGINGKAFVGSATASVELPLIAWSVDPSVDTQRFRNSKTGKTTIKENTFIDCRFTIAYDYDHSANPYLPANGDLSLTGGGTIATRLYINGTSNGYWDFPSAILTGNPMSLAVDGKIVTSISGEANGVWVEPAV